MQVKELKTTKKIRIFAQTNPEYSDDFSCHRKFLPCIPNNKIVNTLTELVNQRNKGNLTFLQYQYQLQGTLRKYNLLPDSMKQFNFEIDYLCELMNIWMYIEPYVKYDNYIETNYEESIIRLFGSYFQYKIIE